MIKHVMRFATAAILCLSLAGPAHAQDVNPPPQHLRLGFAASFPISDGRSGSEPCFTYDFTIAGSGSIQANMGADVAFSYNRADLLPGGDIPIQVTYTPTNDAGPEVAVNSQADVTMNVDVDDVCIGVACGLCVASAGLDVISCGLCAAGAAIDTFHGELDNFDLVSASGNFTAPLMGDPPVVVPGTGDSAVLQFAGSNLAKATPVSSFTLAPTPSAGFPPGLGGAVALLSTSGATLSSPSPLIPVLEWQTPTALAATITLPATPGPTASLTLSPVLHWLNTSASIAIDIDLLGVLGDIFSDPSNIPVFSGNLGSGLGLDALICGGVPAPAQPACLTTVGAGNLPYPALEPQAPNPLPVVTPNTPLVFSSAQLTIDLDADDDGLLDGTEIQIGTDPDDADTDNDGLPDGSEVAHGCNPLVVDTDGDTLTDLQEVTVYGTNCADRDTDHDQLDDNVEIANGTDPLDSDSDNDGIPDGDDVEWLQNAISALPDSVFKDSGKGPGHRSSMLSKLENIESLVANGAPNKAIAQVQILRGHVDGCGLTPDNDDWIVDCTAQVQIRSLLDLYISNLSS
jgi:thrombospondin type 3 repeat protein